MQIVIDIPDSDIPKKQEIITVPIHCIDGIVCEAGGFGFDIIQKGKWIRNERDEDGIYCKCSNCGHLSLLDYDYTGFEDDWETWAMFDFSTIPLQNKNYCSSCGAKMEVEE